MRATKEKSGYLETRTAYEYFSQVNTIESKIYKKFHRNSDIFDLDAHSSMKESIAKDLVFV